MIKFFKIYWAFALNQIKSNFVYKGRFYLFVFRKFLGMFIYYYLWMAIYASTTSGELGGFTRSEMIMYVFMSYTISDIVMISISSEIGSDVINGNVAMNFIKPIDYRIYLVFKSFGKITIHCVNDELEIPYRTCGEILQELDSKSFVQCSRYCIVNKKYIKQIDYTNRFIKLRNVDAPIEIGIIVKKSFKQSVENG